MESICLRLGVVFFDLKGLAMGGYIAIGAVYTV